jgi:hypothetical protein
MAATTGNTTLDTIDDYIADGRILLLDTISPYRYDDASLIIAMNVTLLEARRIRPDLFVYNRCEDGRQVQHIQTKDGTKIQMEDQFRLGILHGMVGHALERDQEDIQDERAATFMGIFNGILLGRGAVSPGPKTAG